MNLGQALQGGLAALGVDTLYGTPVDGLETVSLPDVWMGNLMRAAHHEIVGASGSVEEASGGWRLVVGGDSDAESPSEDEDPDATLGSPGDLRGVLELVATSLDGVGAGRVVVEITADLSQPVDVEVGSLPLVPTASTAGMATAPADVLEALEVAEHPLLLVGPGVVRRGCIPGLHAAATALDCGVLNTWGAKGVFDWRSPHHWATVGLQQRDFELGGVADAGIVVEAGLAGAGPAGAWRVEPEALSPLAASVRGRAPSGVAAGTMPVPPLRTLLAEVTQRGWVHTGPRVLPSQLTRNYGRFTDGRGLVAAGPGLAGYWVARTFPTTALGEAVVPERGVDRGFAVACALVAGRRQPGRPTLAVVDGPLDERSEALLEWARESAIPVVVEVWDAEGLAIGAEAHAHRLARSWWTAVAERGPTVEHVASDSAQFAEMIDAAGPVTAWGGLQTS